MKNTDLAWLAGIYDGEGCFRAKLMNKGRNPGSVGAIGYVITVQSVSEAMINKIEAIYLELGVTYFRDCRMMNKSTRPALKIEVYRKGDVEKVLTLVSKYLVVKKPEALLMLDFLKKYRRMYWNQYMTPVVTNEEKISFIAAVSAAKRIA